MPRRAPTSSLAIALAVLVADVAAAGSLDKALIQDVIRRHRDEIRHCYESQLGQHPRLEGKVVVRFHIAPSGAVSSAKVVESTAANAALETCVAERVGTWVFPKPGGDGEVIVTYPFIFKQSSVPDAGPPSTTGGPTPPSNLDWIWLLACAALGGAGVFSMQQARYLDGDPDAHWWPDHNLPLLHPPRHPHAIKAKRRGWILLGLSVAVTSAGLVVRWVV